MTASAARVTIILAPGSANPYQDAIPMMAATAAATSPVANTRPNRCRLPLHSSSNMRRTSSACSYRPASSSASSSQPFRVSTHFDSRNTAAEKMSCNAHVKGSEGSNSGPSGRSTFFFVLTSSSMVPSDAAAAAAAVAASAVELPGAARGPRVASCRCRGCISTRTEILVFFSRARNFVAASSAFLPPLPFVTHLAPHAHTQAPVSTPAVLSLFVFSLTRCVHRRGGVGRAK
jgi:hypothetical protein